MSGERWHCTADTCDRGCILNGLFYPVDSVATEEAVTWLVIDFFFYLNSMHCISIVIHQGKQYVLNGSIPHLLEA